VLRALPGILVLLFALPSISSAQQRYRVLVQSGVTLPTAPVEFSELWKTGFGGGLGVELGLNDLVSMWGLAEYNRLGFDEQKGNGQFYTPGPPVRVEGGDVSIMGFMVGARLRAPQGVVRPYLDGGFGFQSYQADDVTVHYINFPSGQPGSYTIENERETKPAVSLGIGAQIPVGTSSVGLFADGHWIITFTEGSSSQHVPIRFGLMFP